MSRSARPWLAPLTPLYRLAVGARNLRLRAGFESVRRLHTPVISVGSLSAGGAGKTPLVLALAHALTQRGLHVDILSRGYGRLNPASTRVDPAGTASDFGDEPLLLAQSGFPVYVAAQRYQAGLLAERDADSGQPSPENAMPGFIGVPEGHSLPQGVVVNRAANDPRWANPGPPRSEAPALPRIHLLDDGFQHRQLHRDADIVLFSRHDRDDRLLPAGHLREPLSALRRATILAIPAEDAGLAHDLRWNGPVWHLRRHMEIPQIPGPVLAFCGIARAEQFFLGLEAAGITLAARAAFPDHHRYTPADLARLIAAARAANATAFLTTEKDRIRLGPLTAHAKKTLPPAAQLAEALPLASAALHTEIVDEEEAIAGLLAILARA